MGAVSESEQDGPHEPLLGAVADHSTRRVPIASERDRAGAVRERLIGGEFDAAGEVVVLDGQRLAGLVPIERLLAAPVAAPLAELMDPDPPAVAPGTPQEHAAHRMIEHGEAGLALVDERGRFRGLVPADALLRVLVSEHEEDMARLGGYAAGSRQARGAAEEALTLRLRHRLPWLLVGLIGAMASALLVGAFEKELEEVVLLAFFIPGLIYMAGAVGTQTVTVLIRAMAAGVSPREVLGRELLTGLVVGVIVGAAFVVFILAGWGDQDVALAVGLALFASCGIATLVAIALPAVFQRLGRDPAFGSGPLVTVVQDLASIGVYFAIAVAIV